MGIYPPQPPPESAIMRFTLQVHEINEVYGINADYVTQVYVMNRLTSCNPVVVRVRIKYQKYDGINTRRGPGTLRVRLAEHADHHPPGWSKNLLVGPARLLALLLALPGVPGPVGRHLLGHLLLGCFAGMLVGLAVGLGCVLCCPWPRND